MKIDLYDDLKYSIILEVPHGIIDYYTDINIKLYADSEAIVLFDDNLLYLKNIVDYYKSGVPELGGDIEEKKIGMLFNDYHKCIHEDKKDANIILNGKGEWIGEKYCCFNSISYASWLFKHNGMIVFKVTPLFTNFEKDDYKKRYTEFKRNYKDVISLKLDVFTLKGIGDKVLKFYQDYYKSQS